MSKEFIKITTVNSLAEAEQILQFLKQNGIGGYRQGNIMDVYSGNSNAGEDIYVHETDADKARDILASFEPIKVSSGYGSKYPSGIPKTMCWLLLGVILLLIAFSIYMAVC